MMRNEAKSLGMGLKGRQRVPREIQREDHGREV